MYIGYGAWTGALNEAAVVIDKKSLISEATGLLYGVEETWTISGFLQALEPVGLTLLITAMEAAFSRNNQTIRLLGNDGITVLRYIGGIDPLGGTRVVSGPSFPESGATDAEYTTYRRYQVVVAGRYGFDAPDDTFLSFMETLSFHGGGPRFVHLQPLRGLPVKQLVAESTPYRAIQRGSSVGLYAYPPVPAPIWPDAEQIDQRRIDYRNPKKYGGPQADLYVEWPVEWEYRFEDASELQGVPTVATGV